MASSKLLKERIESIQDTRKITNAMYLISSSKLRKARKNYQNVLPYFTRMRDTISRVVPHLPMSRCIRSSTSGRERTAIPAALSGADGRQGHGRFFQPERAETPAGKG